MATCFLFRSFTVASVARDCCYCMRSTCALCVQGVSTFPRPLLVVFVPLPLTIKTRGGTSQGHAPPIAMTSLARTYHAAIGVDHEGTTKRIRNNKFSTGTRKQDKPQHNTTQHSLAQHSTAPHRTAPHRTAQHSTAQHSTAQHSTAQHSTA